LFDYYLRGGKILSMKKFTVAVLALLLTFSGAFVPKQTFADTDPLLEAALADRLEAIGEQKLSEQLDGFYGVEDEVRIIVELESKPGIVVASDRNVSYDSLSLSEQNQITTRLEVEQQAVKNAILNNFVEMEFLRNFTVAMNGFSGTVKFGDIKVIERLQGVKKVYLANEYEKPDAKIDMLTSGDMVGTKSVWDLDLEGEEQIVAVLDTGIDYRHKDMVLTPGTRVSLTQSDLQGMDLLGKYFTRKVPYGYNYYDLNNEVIDKGPDPSMHGQHVAGTVGANGNVENGGIKGVAPKAQLLAMKVFSNDPIYATTFSDIYLVAIDESIKLGADVINMSLGSTASFYIEDSAESVALQNAVDNGIVAAVSAGNSGDITYGWTNTNAGYPWAQNPDIGVVGAPGLNAPTIQVASVENIGIQARYLTYMVDGVEKNATMTVAGPTDPATVAKNIEYVDGGYGDLTGIDVTGKVVLVQRGGPDAIAPFTEKISSAARAGAAAVIVYNHATGGEGAINMAYPAGVSIPAVFIGNRAGVELLSLETKTLTFAAGTISGVNPSGGQMSAFSSWGVTPTLELKPEITAPGGQIYSTMNNDGYGMMSGTSMAAPHVAGGSAIVMEYVKLHPAFEGFTAKERSEIVKKLLMNTANILTDTYGDPVSPRSQGSGLMNLYGAVTTPVILTDAVTGESKVELKDFTSTNFTMRLTAKNYSDKAVTYAVDTTVLRDYVAKLSTGKDVVGLGIDYVNAKIDAPETVTVPANGTFSFNVKVDFKDDATLLERLTYGFVEGFVVLTDVKDVHPHVQVPFVGFYGDWNEPRIIDGLATSDAFGESYFQFSGFGLQLDGGLYFNNMEELFISPGTESGKINGSDHTFPILTFLRNAEEVNYRITDEDGKLLRNIFTSQFERKDFVDGGRNNPYSIITNATWDGTANGTVVPDGNYVYEIRAKLQGDRDYQVYKMPIGVDTTAPTVTDLAFDPETGLLSWKATDAGSGLLEFRFMFDGQLLQGALPAADGQTEYSVTFPGAENVAKMEVVAYDKVYNYSVNELQAIPDEDPFIFILKPMLLNYFDDSVVEVEGYVTNVNFLEKVLINGTIEADVEFIANAVINHPDSGDVMYAGPAYKFTKEVTLPDGYQEMTIQAISSNGAEGSLARRFYVDTTAPMMEAEVLDRESNSDEATIKFTLSDNLGTLVLNHNDSEIFKYDHPLVIQGETEKTFEYEVGLVDGENHFTFTLVDAVGHEVEKTVTIVKEEPVETPSVTYSTHVQSYGWMTNVSDGEISGTTGQAKRMEAIKIEIQGDAKVGVKYSTHVQSYGWMPFVEDGAISGTTGEAKRMEAIKIELTGEDAELFDVYYQVHAQSYGWLDWAKNGEVSGTTGLAKRLEAIKVVIVPKGDAAPGSTERPNIGN